MSSLYSSFSGESLRRRKGFHVLNGNLLGPAVSVVGAPVVLHPSEQQDDDDDDDDGDESSNFKVDFEKLATMVSNKNNEYIDEVGGVDELAEILQTSKQNGIQGDRKDLRRRRHEFGSNAYWWQNKPRRPVNQDVLGFKRNQWCFLIVIQLCLLVWFLMELLMPKAYSLWNIVAICVCLLTAVCLWLLLLWMRATAEGCEKLLNKTDELKTKVVRGGNELPPIPAHEVVVGDIVILKKGDQIPADGISLEEEHINFMTCGEIVLAEDIRMLVTSVGDNTKFGQDMNFTSYFMQARQNIEQILMFRWFTKRVQKRIKVQLHECDNPIEIGVINDNDRRFSRLNLEALRGLVMEKNYARLKNEFGGVCGILEALESDGNNGIKGDASDLHQRKNSFGSNTFELCQMPHQKVSLWWNLLKALFGYTCFNIWFPAEIALCIKFSKYGAKNWWFLALGIYLLSALIGCGKIILKELDRRCPCYKLKTSLNDFDNAQVQLHNTQVKVIRNGIPRDIPIHDVVVGDIVRLRKGNVVPADGLYIDGESMQLENGFGVIRGKKDEDPFMLFGSVVSHGRACMIVTAVAGNNSYAKLHLKSGIHKPLQTHFKNLISHKEGISILSVVIVPLLLMVRHIKGKQTDEDGIMEMLLATITVVMKSIFRIKSSMLETPLWNLLRPDKFAKEVNAVPVTRRLDMSDWLTAGKVTTIITEEKSMQEVVEFRLNAEIMTNISSKVPQVVLEGLRRVLALYSISEPVSQYEETLQSWGEFELGIRRTELTQTFLIEDSESENELRWTWIRKKCDERARYLYCRGDAEMLLSRCSDYHENDGTKNPLNEDLRRKIEAAIQDMKAKNLFCIALAHKHVKEGSHGKVEANEGNHGEPNGGVESNECDRCGGYDNGGSVGGEIEEFCPSRKEENDLEKDGLTLLGIVGLGGEQRKIVKCLQDMGINVKMVSSENTNSFAIAVAKACGVLAPNQKEDEIMINAEVYRQCSNEEAKRKLTDRMCLMFSATAMDKLHLVECLKQNDEVVAVIGRTEDDASVLKEADVGFIMESWNTTAVNERAEFLIVDGSLTSIYKTLKWMRWLDNCLIKFIHLQLVMQIPVFILNSVTAYFSGVTHITDFVLFILDTVLPLVAIPTIYDEPLTENELKKSYGGRNVLMMVIKALWKGVIIQATVLTAILLYVHFRAEDRISGWTKTDMIKMVLMVGQILNIVIIGFWRANRWKWGSKLFLLMLVVTLIIPTIDFRFLRREWVAFLEIFTISSAVGFFMLFYKMTGELSTVIHEH